MTTAIALLTKDRTELTAQSLKPLLAAAAKRDPHLYIIDGSTTDEGKHFAAEQGVPDHFIHSDVRGGAGAAIVYALTTMLRSKTYAFVGLCEQDTVLPNDWFEIFKHLWRDADSQELNVGAVSLRCYQDRILFQRDGYAVMHNLGAGNTIFTRDAARLVLDHFRSGWTTDNRKVFCQLSGIDVGPFWAFRHGNHSLVADWHWDAVLAAHGYASVAPVPSHVEMIGQNPPLADQGLIVVKQPLTERIDNTGFERYRDRLRAVREGQFKVNVETRFQQNDDGITYLPHQWHMLGGKFAGEWRFKETRGLGEFGYVSSDHNCRCVVPVFGLASLLVSSQNDNAQIEIVDEYSGYRVAPILPKAGPQTQALQIPLPGNIAYRNIHISPLAPGICLYRLITRDPQPTQGPLFFDHSILPEPL